MLRQGLAIVAQETEHPPCSRCGAEQVLLWPGELCTDCYRRQDPAQDAFWVAGVELGCPICGVMVP